MAIDPYYHPACTSFTHHNQMPTDWGTQLHGPLWVTQDTNTNIPTSSSHDSHTMVHWGHDNSVVGDHNHNTINNVGGNQIVKKVNGFDPLQALWQAITDVGAMHNSEVRYPPPKCYPETRKEVRQLLANEIDSHASSWVCWLYGSADIGKSAVAQTIAEDCEQSKKLVASFFFSRIHPKRNKAIYEVLGLVQ
ncbi:hypothetical protein E1B28_009608 [Marasmius oreades]|uniref:Nephrocystin 3-like N-terminal domain-containing protein n=1 Tax=Marasmius oreades TaxID=181124 RepID=A0A9P7RVM7_9AGAR|nr:uncharacterized protein E1B28_009608 [Marasmius oreades]KAG7090495.1 hypothetical protein E1B28_009608 [Marasmius oreades]